MCWVEIHYHYSSFFQTKYFLLSIHSECFSFILPGGKYLDVSFLGFAHDRSTTKDIFLNIFLV